MSSVVNPVGPEDPSIYWRRRAVVAVGLLVFLWLGWMVLSAAFGSSSSASAPTPKPTPTFGLSLSESPSDDEADDLEDEVSSGASSSASGTATDSASATPSVSASASPSGTTSDSASASPSASGTCPAGQVKVSATTASKTVTSGAGTSLTIAVANTGTAGCVHDVGSGANEIQVVSATGEVVFSSDDCNPSQAKKEIPLDPSAPWSATVTWDGRASSAGCASAGAAVPPGIYTVIARNGALKSAPVTVTVQ